MALITRTLPSTQSRGSVDLSQVKLCLLAQASLLSFVILLAGIMLASSYSPAPGPLLTQHMVLAFSHKEDI